MSSTPTLRDAWLQSKLSGMRWKGALEHPWCRPDGGETRPEFEPRPGDVLLLAATNDSKGSLWRVARPGAQHKEAVDDAHTVGVWSWVDRLALTHILSVATEVVTAQANPLQVERVYSDSVTTRVEGGSFGASLALSRASSWMEAPVPVDLAASATVAQDGTLGPVDGLAAKVEVLYGFALAVKRLVVSEEQRAEAEELAKGKSLEIIGMRHVRELFELAWPDFEEEVLERWTANPVLAVHRARELERWVMASNPTLPEWKAIERGGTALAKALGTRVEAGAASRSALIARRHSGGVGTLEWPAEEELPRTHELRMRYLAHVVQAAADGDSPGHAKEIAARAELCLRPRDERGVGDLKLAGAIGRAWSAVGTEDARALALLVDVVEDWFEIAEPEQSSYALCEAIRLAAVTRDEGASSRIEPIAHWWSEVAVRKPSLAASARYIDCEKLRACVLGDRIDEAVQLALRLERGEFEAASQHLPFSILRWGAVAFDLSGRAADAQGWRARANGLGHEDSAWLLALDEHVRDGLPELPPQPTGEHPEIRRCSRLYGHLPDAAHAVQRAYRY